eukprot:CAMPEP_0184649452 /NCGR_PEP_ID=MMETSP0308-20130426/6827_1 /TAXON_ID=38269 /ORGANISM="Gloeochaete witrockiana, Strain SAG 46.84" /LENGTH=205 /DNA_ID=CAMNT_0027082187 /DNA_START=518 /DNA_END=1135 /DNA_ORIENTATION=+
MAAGAVAIVLGTLALSYAAVPLYKAFCQMTGFGGQTQVSGELGATAVKDLPVLQNLEKIPRIRIEFNADVSDKLHWSFKPLQKEIKVRPGETALAFYEAINHSGQPITGVATYNVQPPQAGAYFNKVQCFCFDEQRLNAGEKVDMPVFFFIDPEILKDPKLANMDHLILSYTFFKAYDPENPDEEVENIPMQKHSTPLIGIPRTA